MTLTQLRYLVAIADADLNITLAAARVHATQPGLSKQLKQLEDELGFLLFVRKGRSLESVTPAGQVPVSMATPPSAAPMTVVPVGTTNRNWTPEAPL